MAVPDRLGGLLRVDRLTYDGPPLARDPGSISEQTWTARGYAENAAFVPALGADVLGWLDPKPAERILDLGCGDGALTVKLVEAGATVIGVDTSAEMLTA